LSDQPGGVLPGTITEETNCRERLPWKTCSATIVGIATRRGSISARRAVSALPAESSEATITLQPVDDHGEAGEEESAVTLVEVPHGTGVLVVKRGPEGGQALPPRRRHHPGRGVTPRATSSWTTSPCRGATPNWSVDPAAKSVIKDVGSLNGTYVNRERIETAVLSGGDEVQVGKFKLVYLVAGDE